MSAPLTLLTLVIRNFLSFGNSMTTIELTGDGTTHITGENLDTNSNNGAGKTTIINAICYALYNKPFDNISLQRLINSTNNLKNTLMEVKLTFTKGEDEYTIHRTRGETFNIAITKNGDDITLDSVTENDKAIEEIIGMSYELFTKIVVFSGNSTPFLQMPVSQQRQQIEELFNITLLSEKAVKLKEIIKSTENAIAIQDAVIKEQEAQITLYNRQLTDAEARIDRWENDRFAQIEALTSDLQLIEFLKTVNMDEEKELHALTDQLEKTLSPLNSSVAIAKRDRSTAATDVRKLTEELEHLIVAKCPYCLQKYESADKKILEKQELFNKKQDRVIALDEKIRVQQGEIDSINEQIGAARSIMKFTSFAEAVRAESAAIGAQQKINDLSEAINPHIDAYEQLKNTAIKKASYAELDFLKKDLEHQQFLLRLLTDKNSFIRRRIINRTIPFLNSRLIHYTKELGLPHVVKFDDDMSCTVSEYGRELDFGNLSSGEKKRVNLSLSLAFRDVLHHLHSRVNCLFIDEIDGSLDGPGVESVFRLLKQKSRDEGLGLWIISHRPEAVGRFDRYLIVRKENGFSRIVDEKEAA